MQVKIFQASNPEDLEKTINEWLKHRHRINIQKMKMEVQQHLLVVLILYFQAEPEIC